MDTTKASFWLTFAIALIGGLLMLSAVSVFVVSRIVGTPTPTPTPVPGGAALKLEITDKVFDKGKGVQVFLLAQNTGSVDLKLTRITTNIEVSAGIQFTVDKNYVPNLAESGTWDWTPDTGFSGTTLTLDGSTDKYILLPGNSTVEVARVTLTAANSGTAKISQNPLISIATQFQTGANMIDLDNTPASQPITVR